MQIVTTSQFIVYFLKRNRDINESKELEIVKTILDDVKQNGDAAVRKYTQQFDDIELTNFEISKNKIKEAYRKVDKKIITAIKLATRSIRTFAKAQFQQLKDFEIINNDVILGQKVIPLTRVGCYVPGGRYSLPSSALMSIIPAKIAGVKEIMVCSPKITPVTIVAADIAGADRIFNIGGVQAIGAMAFGTETIPKVDKIVGPGNKYVAEAKKQVFSRVGIDFIAGPSEVLIIADDTGNPAYIAADMLAQAEHDLNARANVITTSKKLARIVKDEINQQLIRLKTKDIAKQGLENSRIIIVNNLSEAADLANNIAPEHLELQVKAPDKIINQLTNYGSLFIGNESAEVFGDYCSGTNHILPTGGAARYSGGLSVRDFVKFLTYQKILKKGLKQMIKMSSTLAEIEGLDGHRKAALMRFSPVPLDRLNS